MKHFIYKSAYIVFYTGFVAASWAGLLRKGKWHKDMSMRFGRLPASVNRAKDTQKTIWVHAVSVGEIQVIVPIVEALNALSVKPHIVVSTVTKTGYELAWEKLGKTASVIFAPLDFAWVVRIYINQIKPALFISAETELWPNLMFELKKNYVPIVQVNGRISDSAFEGYKKIKTFIALILKTVRLFCVQSDADAARLITLGAEPLRIHVVGNLKFDLDEKPSTITRADLGFNDEQTLLVAGSTHPGEEVMIIDMFNRLRDDYPELALLIAPRHVERSDEVYVFVDQAGLTPVKYSRLTDENKGPEKIVIVDTIGQLRNIYALASIVYIGKSFPPGGGQNIIEPAYHGKAIVTGPAMHNFKDVVRIFKDEKAFVQVKTPQELEKAIKTLLENESAARELGKSAKNVVEKYRGAKGKTITLLNPILHEVLSNA